MFSVDLHTVQGLSKDSIVLNVAFANLSIRVKGFSFVIGVVRNFFGLANFTFGNEATIFPLLSLIFISSPNFLNVCFAVFSLNFEAKVSTQEYLRI